MMKINISKIEVPPKNIQATCAVYKVTEEVKEWINENGLEFEIHQKGYYNIKIESLRFRFNDLFYTDEEYYYFDGFSPNLNKNLHLGHLSNLVYASAISNMNSYLNTVSILNDSDNHNSKELFFKNFQKTCKQFNYNIDRNYFSSNMCIDSFSKEPKNSDYESLNNWNKQVVNFYGNFTGCKGVISPLSSTKVVVKKSNGKTTYMGQDLDFARKLQEPILYLTGSEQTSHFEIIKEFFPKNNHIGIGLITVNGKKMSSRKGNVLFINDILKEFSLNTIKDTFFQYNQKSFKKDIEIKQTLSKNFQGESNFFENEKLYLFYLKAKQKYTPSVLFQKLFSESKNDIDYGLKLMGYQIDSKAKAGKI